MSFHQLPFLDVFKDATGGNTRTPRKEFLNEGRFPVVDQGQDLVAGFVNDRSRVCNATPPVIVFGDHTRAIKYVDFEFAMGADGTKVLVPKLESDTKYLYHALKAITITAAGYSRHYKFLKEARIPFPPLAEQKRIAGILDAADALRAKRRESISQCDTLIQSVFLDMFGEHSAAIRGSTSNPNGWKVSTVGDVTTCLDRMRRPVKAADRVAGDVPYYGANGQQGWMNEALFDEPLVLVAEDGGHFNDPARGVAYRIDGPAWVNNHAHVLRPLDAVHVEYLHRALRHYDFSPYISGSTRAKLNQRQLNRAKLLVPPLDLQRRFAAIVESVEQQKARQQAHLTEVNTLFASLQSRAFRGDL